MALMFLTILAWIGSVGGGLLVIGRLWASTMITDRQHQLLLLRGEQITFPLTIPSCVFVVSTVFLVARYFH